MIKAVIFDFDGLIVDTETPWFEVFSAIYQEYGTNLPLEKWAQCIGASDKHFDPYDYLEACIQRTVDRVAVRKLSIERHAQLMEQKNILPGVEDYLKTARLLGLKIGLASSSGRDWVEKYLNQFKLIEYFDCIYTRDDVKNVKPNPDLYEKALRFFNISGDEAIAFEDSPNGLKAARTAGLCCVAIPNEITCKLDFNQDNYDIMLNSMVEKDVRELLQIFNNGQ